MEYGISIYGRISVNVLDNIHLIIPELTQLFSYNVTNCCVCVQDYVNRDDSANSL